MVVLCCRGIAEPVVPAVTVRHRGKPVYNSAFGVHKEFVEIRSGETVSTLRTLRLILNLVPTNALQQSFSGKGRRVGYPGSWPTICLCDDELMVMAGEDPKGCFYSYLMPEAWRGYFVLERTVSRQAAGLLASGPPIRIRIRTCPMGWINAVDFIDEAHKGMATEPAPASADIAPPGLVGMGHRAPPMFWALPLNWFSVYVDNFDQGTIILRTLEKEYTFTSSGTQVALRDACGAVAGHDLYMVARMISTGARSSWPVSRRARSTLARRGLAIAPPGTGPSSAFGRGQCPSLSQLWL